MKKIKVFIWVVLASLLTENTTYAKCIEIINYASIDQIANAFTAKNPSQSIASFIDKTIEMTIYDKESSYSKSQAEAVLNVFFQNNTIIGFKLIHQGSSPDDSSFGIGNLATSKGNYKVIFYTKNKGNQVFIQELRFEKN